MKPSTALKEVRFILEHSDTIFVCSAIDKARLPYRVKERLWDRVDELLGPHGSLEGWLHVNYLPYQNYVSYVVNSDYSAVLKQHRDLLKQTRLNWVDWMIEDFKSRGE